MNGPDRRQISSSVVSPTGNPSFTGSPNRRRILRGATAAVPTILTLHSGAALARSSNLMSVADGTPVDAHGRNLCVDESSVKVDSGLRKVYDLGEPPRAQVTAIPTRRAYYRAKSSEGPRVSGREMCESGGDFYYKDGHTLESLDVGGSSVDTASGSNGMHPDSKGQGWKQVKVRRGGLVSATALKSFAGRVHIREI